MRPDPPPRCELVARQLTRQTITLSNPAHPLHRKLAALRRRLAKEGKAHPGADFLLSADERRTIQLALHEAIGNWDAAEARAADLQRRLARAEVSYRRRNDKPGRVLDQLLGKTFSRLGPGLLPWAHPGQRRGTVNRHAIASDYLKIRHGAGTVELFDPLAAATGDPYQALAVSDCPRQPDESVVIAAYWNKSSWDAVLKDLHMVKSAAEKADPDLALKLDPPRKGSTPPKSTRPMATRLGTRNPK